MAVQGWGLQFQVPASSTPRPKTKLNFTTSQTNNRFQNPYHASSNRHASEPVGLPQTTASLPEDSRSLHQAFKPGSNTLAFQDAYEPYPKLLKGDHLRDYVGEYHRSN